MRKLKAGIVGCGGIANGKHLPAMKKSGLYEINRHSVTSSERAESKEYGRGITNVAGTTQEAYQEGMDQRICSHTDRSMQSLYS